MKVLQICLVMGMGFILATDLAWAGRARGKILGSGTEGMINQSGSMYYETNSNIFYNPSYVNQFNNWAVIEKGATLVEAWDGAAISKTSVGEAGFALSLDDIHFGFYFNRTSAFGSNTLGSNSLQYSEIRPVDFFVGSEFKEIKWGLGATFAFASGDAVKNAFPERNPVGAPTVDFDHSQNLTLRLGAQYRGFDPYINYRLIGRAKAKTTTTTGSGWDVHDWTVGLRYHMEDWTTYGAFRHESSHADTAYSAVNYSRTNSYLVGLGRSTRLSEGARATYGLSLIRSVKDEIAAVTGDRVSKIIVPVSFALEGDFSSWLTLRAGMNFKLVNTYSGVKATSVGSQADDTTARVGATARFGKLSFEWVFADSAGIDSSAFGFDGGTFNGFSMTYQW